MGLVETEALILKSYTLAEADKIVVFFTEDEGLVRGVAKGARRLKSKFGGGLEPFSRVRISYFEKDARELVSIQNVELRSSFFEKACDPVTLKTFSYLSELLAEFAPPHEPNTRLYRMASILFDLTASDINKLDQITIYFELWVLKLSGYLPDWTRCRNCKRVLSNDESASMQADFHLLCQDCQKAKSPWNISHIERGLFYSAQTTGPQKFLEFASDKTEAVVMISTILKRIISQTLGKEIINERILAKSI